MGERDRGRDKMKKTEDESQIVNWRKDIGAGDRGEGNPALQRYSGTSEFFPGKRPREGEAFRCPLPVSLSGRTAGAHLTWAL